MPDKFIKLIGLADKSEGIIESPLYIFQVPNII